MHTTKCNNFVEVERVVSIVHLHDHISTMLLCPAWSWLDLNLLSPCWSCKCSKQIATCRHARCRGWQTVREPDGNVLGPVHAFATGTTALPVVDDNPCNRHPHSISKVEAKPRSWVVQSMAQVFRVETVSDSINAVFSSRIMGDAGQDGSNRAQLN